MFVELVSSFLLSLTCFISCCPAQAPTSANKTDLITQCTPNDMIVESFFAIEGSPYYLPTLNFSLYNPNGEDQYTDCLFVSQTTPAVYGEGAHFCNNIDTIFRYTQESVLTVWQEMHCLAFPYPGRIIAVASGPINAVFRPAPAPPLGGVDAQLNATDIPIVDLLGPVPDCANECFGNITSLAKSSGCAAPDFSCICAYPDFFETTSSCLLENCSDDGDIGAGEAFFTQFCSYFPLTPTTTQAMPPQATAGFNVSSVSMSERVAWCGNETETCNLICRDGAALNTCNQYSLMAQCICSNGTVPDLTAYIDTLPYFICQASLARCINSHTNDLQSQANCTHYEQCGTGNATAEIAF